MDEPGAREGTDAEAPSDAPPVRPDGRGIVPHGERDVERLERRTAVASGALGECRNDADPLEIRRDEGVAAFRHAAPLESHGAAVRSETTSWLTPSPPGWSSPGVGIKRGGEVDLERRGGRAPLLMIPPRPHDRRAAQGGRAQLPSGSPGCPGPPRRRRRRARRARFGRCPRPRRGSTGRRSARPLLRSGRRRDGSHRLGLLQQTRQSALDSSVGGSRCRGRELVGIPPPPR